MYDNIICRWRHFYFFLPNLFMFNFWLMEFTSTSSMMLKNGRKGNILIVFLILVRKLLLSQHLNVMSVVHFSRYSLSCGKSFALFLGYWDLLLLMSIVFWQILFLCLLIQSYNIFFTLLWHITLASWPIWSQDHSLSDSMKLSHAMWGHPRWTGHGGEVSQSVVYQRMGWQKTSVFFPSFRTPWTVGTVKKFGNWKMNSPGR